MTMAALEVVGAVDIARGSGSIPQTSLSSLLTAGLYRVTGYLALESAASDDNVVALSLQWNDGLNEQASDPIGFTGHLRAGSFVTFDQVVYVALGLSYQLTITGSGTPSAPLYDLHLRVVSYQ